LLQKYDRVGMMLNRLAIDLRRNPHETARAPKAEPRTPSHEL
jgi:hypothetical protein